MRDVQRQVTDDELTLWLEQYPTRAYFKALHKHYEHAGDKLKTGFFIAPTNEQTLKNLQELTGYTHALEELSNVPATLRAYGLLAPKIEPKGDDDGA